MAPKNPVGEISILWFVTSKIISYSTPKWFWMLHQQYLIFISRGIRKGCGPHSCLLPTPFQPEWRKPISNRINSEWTLAWSRRRPGVTPLHLLQTLLQTKNSTSSTDRRCTSLSKLRLGRRERVAASSLLLSSRHGSNSPSHTCPCIFPWLFLYFSFIIPCYLFSTYSASGLDELFLVLPLISQHMWLLTSPAKLWPFPSKNRGCWNSK